MTRVAKASILDTLIEEFWSQNPYYAVPSEAFGLCHHVTLHFLKFTKSKGVRGRILRLAQPLFRIERELHVGWQYYIDSTICHSVAWFRTERKVVDWTARQFRAEVSYPLIMSRKKLAEEWGNIKLLPRTKSY